MRCPGCGEVNEEGYAFCRSCGRALKVDEGQTTVPLARAEQLNLRQSPSSFEVASEFRPASKLTATAGLLSGRTFTIGRNGLVIGRDPVSCQVVVADDEISRVHAWIGYKEDGRVILRDQNSANGTYVNQVRIQEKVIHETDEISFGTGRRQLFRLVPPHQTTPVPTPTVPSEAPPQAGAPGSPETPIPGPGEKALVQEEDADASTVKLQVTDLTSRPHMELIVDKYAVRKLEIPGDGLVVGRDPMRCALVLEHPSVSGVHCVFQPGEGKVKMTDCSTNGTFINGLRAPYAELHDGDYITFGRYAGKSLIFRTGLEPEPRVEAINLDKDKISIGRDPSNDIFIDHPAVSKRHAEIVRQGGQVLITDLGSTNGTFVNGIKVKRHQLQELDRIVVGPSELRFTGASLARVQGGSVVRLDVRDLSFQVPDRSTGKPKLLLEGVSLVVRPRELIGLLGPSGAGKTALMNALNGFVKPTSGQVLYNQVDLYRNLSRLKSTIGFVPQEDIMHTQLSVRRCLDYAAKLRLPDDLSDAEMRRLVDEMLEILKIDPQVWDHPVATLSGGQRKRVSIGIELLSKPGVLFLDEPTAGLDPRTETLMMMLLRQLANQGSTVILTTHLLASFGVLDKVAVLVQGRLAFYGPGTKLLSYFKAETPPDIYDDLTDNNTVPYALELKKRYSESSLHKELIADPLKSVQAETSRPGASPGEQSRWWEFSLHQLKVLAGRAWDLKFGHRAQSLLLFLQAPVVALLVALMASGSNQIQTLFMAMFAALWFGCSNAVREIVDEQSVYRRERQTGLKIPSYILSKLLILSFVALAQCASVLIVLLLVNHALSLSPSEVLGACVVLFLVAMNGTLIGLVISALVRTPQKALALFPLVLIPELLLSGLFLPVRTIRTVIPISVEQLFEGKMFGPPEAQRKAEQMMQPPPAETVTAAPPKSQEATPTPALEGESAQQVVGAMAPSEPVQKAFHKYTPAPVDGMPPPVRWLSALAVSRWGLEALADLCVHGRHSKEESAFKIINSVYISLHPQDLEKLEAGLSAGPEASAQPGSFPLPSHLWRDQGPYLGVLAGFAFVMTWVVLIVMKRKDVN